MTLDVVVLAAGQGTRMKSKLPKVLHALSGKPLVMYSVEAAQQVSGRLPVVVVAHSGEQVRETVGGRARFVEQAEQLGTGHAVIQARDLLKDASEHVIVIYGDMPLLRAETLRSLYEEQQTNSGPFSMLTLVVDKPRGFGRIIRNEDGSVRAIVEQANATPEQLAIREVNVGIYCFNAAWLWEHLDQIPRNPTKGEFYLTDLVEIAAKKGLSINALAIPDPDEGLGINTRVHLAEAEAVIRRRTCEEAMLAGVTIVDPATTYIQSGCEIGADTIILPNTHITEGTIIGSDCTIGPNAVVQSSTIGDRCIINASVIEYATLENDCEIGPFGHLRKGAYLEQGVHMGNFGEVKNSRLRKGVRMGHFSYVGDGDIGEETNIGAGTITCNYDGKQKHKTIVGKGSFIGSDTMLVAPITLGDGSRTGAGSVVTHNVPDGGLVYGVPARPPKNREDDA